MGRNFWAKLSANRTACNGTSGSTSASSETLDPFFWAIPVQKNPVKKKKKKTTKKEVEDLKNKREMEELAREDSVRRERTEIRQERESESQ